MAVTRMHDLLRAESSVKHVAVAVPYCYTPNVLVHSAACYVPWVNLAIDFYWILSRAMSLSEGQKAVSSSMTRAHTCSARTHDGSPGFRLNLQQIHK